MVFWDQNGFCIQCNILSIWILKWVTFYNLNILKILPFIIVSKNCLFFLCFPDAKLAFILFKFSSKILLTSSASDENPSSWLSCEVGDPNIVDGM